MKKLTLVFQVLFLAIVLFVPSKAAADGGFVMPKFVWDKHKDINEPTQKAILVYDGGQEDMVLQVKYGGPVDEFGWLIPVPNLPKVQEGSMKCFYELSQFTQQKFNLVLEGPSAGITRGGPAPSAEPPVKVIETKTVGAYEVAILSARDSGALAQWLEANQFYLPADKNGVIDTYVKQQWYFVAVRINLSKSEGFQLLASPRQAENESKANLANYSTHLKLASGELNPLQISFASDRCVFPLKISSINGRPSEVEVYVLSPEPLLESTMLEKQQPLIYSNDMARAARETPQRTPEAEEMIERTREIFFTSPDELLPYAKVTKADLPDCSRWLPRLAEKSWWLTKQTWTFKPKEMRDLDFEPALPVFLEKLGSKYGFFAAASLTPFGADAVPTIIAAMHSTNPIVRMNAAGNFSGAFWGYGSTGYRAIRDPRLAEAAVAWLTDPEATVREAGVQILMDSSGRELDIKECVPVFRQMLNNDDFNIRLTALIIIEQLNIKTPRGDLLPFFKSSNPEAYSRAFIQMEEQGERISDDEVIPLLQNPAPVARLFGLYVLHQNADKHSVELALPLLKDADALVRTKAEDTLCDLTGQHFTEDQVDEWIKWWMANKTNLVAQPHP